ncbi:MAG TPA: AI-2E family transporter [Bacteroidia bacterium]|jgi:predicted PurR-regulated permease PerM|nr:AI-2E family transporter [Bacteroidia bacterium]
MDIASKIPVYVKVALIFIGVFAFVFTMYIGQEIILPLVFAALIAILLNPVVNFLMKKKIGKIFSISIVVVLATVAVMGILYLISSQITVFRETFPQLKNKVTSINNNFIDWVSVNFRIPRTDIISWIKNSENGIMHNFSIGENLFILGKFMVDSVILPIYAFLILYYKPLILDFILKLFRKQHHATVTEVLISTKKIIQSYLVGVFIEMLIIAILNTASLLLLGIDYAIILGILGAIINIIPYLGGIIAMLIPMIIACVTKDSISYTIYIFIIFTLISFIDNHYIKPYIVASRIKINALVALIVIFIGDAVWGIPGMFLSIPLTAMAKVIFDHIESLKPFGFILGNTMPASSKFSFLNKKQKVANTHA